VPMAYERSLQVVATTQGLRSAEKAGNRTPSWARSSAAEHLTFNQRVVGSIPTGLTSVFNT
jgi:hypothetical protein